jgi:hypothetical protein
MHSLVLFSIDLDQAEPGCTFLFGLGMSLNRVVERFLGSWTGFHRLRCGYIAV